MGVAARNGRNARFSLRYKPGATNIQTWLAMTGNATNMPPKNATLMYVKNASYSAVKIRCWLLPPCSASALASGAARNE